MVAPTPVPLLDAGPVRPAVDLSRRRAWLRRHGVAADPGSAPAGCRSVGCVGGLHSSIQLQAHGGGMLGPHANWRPELDGNSGAQKLVQFCHGAPGFVVCLAGLPGAALDDLLLAAGRPSGRPARCSRVPRNSARHRRQRLRAAEAVRADRRRSVAGTRAVVRHARHRPDRRARAAPRADAVLAVDRRPRIRRLPVGLPARGSAVPVVSVMEELEQLDGQPACLRAQAASSRRSSSTIATRKRNTPPMPARTGARTPRNATEHAPGPPTRPSHKATRRHPPIKAMLMADGSRYLEMDIEQFMRVKAAWEELATRA